MSNSYYQWCVLVRNYVRENALCRSTTNFDAKSWKIHRVAQPEADTDAVNKRYVEQSIKIAKKQQQEEFDKRMFELGKDIETLEIAITELRRVIESVHVPNTVEE